MTKTIPAKPTALGEELTALYDSLSDEEITARSRLPQIRRGIECCLN